MRTILVVVVVVVVVKVIPSDPSIKIRIVLCNKLFL